MKEQNISTKHWLIHIAVDNSVDKLIHNPHLQEAAKWIQEGEVIAFPTETVYGLGADAHCDRAVQKIFEAKGRPGDNPLIVHIAHKDQLSEIVDNVPPLAEALMEAYWPGPLTLVLQATEQISQTVRAGLPTVAVRMPDHPVALALITMSGQPLAAPSANRSGKPSPTRAEHVIADLWGSIAGVLDAGETGVGLESTVVDVTGPVPLILRPGGITKQQLEEVVGQVEWDPALLGQGEEHKFGREAEEITPRSPGVKYQHYAPEAELWIVSRKQGLEKMRETIQRLSQEDQARGILVGIITTEEGKRYYQTDQLLSVGSRADIATIARGLYQALRVCDQLGLERVYVESFETEGIGEAIMNRLLKAAAGNWLEPF